MASQKISEFSVISSLASGDYFPVVQNSDTSNKRVLTQQIFQNVPAGTASSPSLAFAGDDTGLFSPGDNQLAVSTSGVQTIFVDQNGDIYASGVINAAAGSSAAPSIAFAGDDTGLYSPSADQIAVTNSGVQTVLIDQGGIVSASGMVYAPVVAGDSLVVYDESPTSSGFVALNASGVTGSVVYYLPPALGTSGASLTTDASGYLSWVSHLPLAGGALTGNLTLNAQSDLRFADTDSSNYVGFQAPGTVSSDVLWTLPDADGSSGQVLSTDGAGTLSWATGGGGGGGGATGSGLDEIFYENDQTVTGSYTITTGKNAMSAGPIAVASGVTVTVPSGSVWTVV
jgi:hypothetical protein